MVATQVVELNVGGYCFTTLRSTLCKHEDSMLSRMFAGDLAPAYQDTQGRYFIDRDGTHFGIVLAYLRGQPLQLPSSLADRSALVAEALFYQLQGLQDMLTLGHTDVSDSIGSKPTYEDLGKLHIKEGELLLQQHARAQIGPCKLNRICEVLTRFYFGERGQTSSRPALSGQKEDIPLFGRISADAARTSAFTLYKEYVGYGGKSASLRYPWSALGNHDGYAGFWRLSCWSQSPKLVDIDADELVHLLYTYAVLFQTEMELRGLKLALQCSDALANALESRDMRFSVSLSM